MAEGAPPIGEAVEKKPNLLVRALYPFWKYKVYIIFPSVSAWLIWLDYTHTQKWKAEKQQQAELLRANSAKN